MPEGKNYKHFCYDWDGLEIDENCFEITCCNCFERDEYLEVKIEQQMKLLDLHNEEMLRRDAEPRRKWTLGIGLGSAPVPYTEGSEED